MSLSFVLLTSIALVSDAELLLAEGLSNGLAGHRAAEAAFRSIEEPSPRERFAMALVHRRHTRHSDAMNCVEPLRGSEAFLPGWEAVLRLNAERGDFGPLLEDLPKLGAAAKNLGEADRRDFAFRLGRLTAATELSVGVKDGEAVWLATLESLPSPLQARFDAGYRETLAEADRRVQEIRDRIERKRKTVAHEAAASISETEEELAKAVSAKLRGTVNAEEIDEVAEEFSGEAQDAIERIEDVAAAVEADRVAAEQLVTTLTIDLARTLDLERRDREEGRFVRRNQLLSNAIELQLADANFALAEAGRRAREVAIVAARLNRRFASEQQKINAARSQLAEVDAKRSREVTAAMRRLDRLREKLKQHKKQGPIVPPRLSFRQLVPWDFEAEARRIASTTAPSPRNSSADAATNN